MLGFRRLARPVRRRDGRTAVAKGVKFEDYDIPEMGLKTTNGVAELGGMKSAWFKDTEGNILNLASM